MAFQKAVEQMGQILRWTEQPRKPDEKTLYLGPVVNGFYKSMKTGVGQNDSSLYEIQLKDGTLVSIWGSSLLDGKFKEIPQGCEIRLTYLGIAQPKKSSGRAYQNFELEYDVNSRIPMSTAGAAAPAAAPVAAARPAAAPAAVPGHAPAGNFGQGF